MQKISSDTKKIILGIIKFIFTYLFVVFLTFSVLILGIYIGASYDVRLKDDNSFGELFNLSYEQFTAFAAEEPPSDNGLSIYPNSTSILAPGFDYRFAPLYEYGGADDIQYYDVSVEVTRDNTYFDLYPNSLIQFIFYVDNSMEDDYYYYLDNVSLPFSYFDVASDNGWADKFFVYEFYFLDAIDSGSYPTCELSFHQFVDDFNIGYESVYLYDIRLLDESTYAEDEPISESFFAAISDGLTFGFGTIPTGISYIFDELFVVDGKLTPYSYAVFSLCGISIVLGLIKFILSFIFSLGGK